MNQTPQPRRDRRMQARPTTYKEERMELPGPLRILTHPRAFIIAGVLFGGGIVLSLFFGILGLSGSSGSTAPHQANEAPDVARDASGTPIAGGTPTTEATPGVIKRYTVAPGLIIDPAKQYNVTIKTPKGDVGIVLYPDQATQAVNSFVYLADDGYYNGTPFMELTKNPDGSAFTVQAGDPTRTGLGSPGYSVKKESTNRPFVKGAVGMGGSSQDSNGGQFFISLGDYPALNGKYTIIGQVVSGMDVLDKLSLLDLTTKAGSANNAGADTIQSIVLIDPTTGQPVVNPPTPTPPPAPPAAAAPPAASTPGAPAPAATPAPAGPVVGP
jgi:peptidyl-prolyl cis-trans isomerase B (cyclophilin B)